MKIPRLLWTPAHPESSRLSHYVSWLANTSGLHFTDYADLWRWSTDETEAFWESLVRYFDIRFHNPYTSVLTGVMPRARWFSGGTLNYAEQVFRNETDAWPALLFCSENQPLTEISWSELRTQTARFAAWLKEQGVGPGDRVAAYLPTVPEATAALLATLSVGAIWSSTSPDFGVGAAADRFAQIEPKVLLGIGTYRYGGKLFDKTEAVLALAEALPGLPAVVWVQQPEKAPGVYWESIQQSPEPELAFTPVEFNHPIWILYSSGTTGLPKPIVHSHGGVLLEHLKYLVLHNDVRPGERFFWYTTTGWMMWNFLNASLLAGATAVLYDGSPGYPGLDFLWQLARDARIAHFGTSAPFIGSCLKAGLTLPFDLPHLRTIGSTGSPLSAEGFDWVYAHVKPDVWLSSMSGGTDVCTAWVGANPWRPVYEGEIQCRCLGCAMDSFDEDGHPLVDEVGEMVVTQPMPSMPVFFWNDPDFQRYTESYFETYPGVWRHGDWLKITKRDTLVILGRSDATLNRQGVRIGTAEIYRATDTFPEIRDSLIVHLEETDYMPLFVVLQEGIELSPALDQRIRQAIRQACSPRHVPDRILAVPDIPYTLSGKKLEKPVKQLLQGKPLEKVMNPGSVRNPGAMEWFNHHKNRLSDHGSDS
ncbi:MAG: acetoacetate--CoA ligase [Siphonobacter aquaeclarae]|nr:acetoacetate--CoA ligase [Siphonobacter aquaeclarae]